MNDQTPAYLAGIDYANSHAPHFRYAPLSGEWSGESMPEIADAYDLPTDSDDWADDFEEGYFSVASAYPDADR